MKPNLTSKRLPVQNLLVSVIMPVYNSEKYIEQSVKSILNQTYDYFELIIINDASTDKTTSILTELKDPRIKLIHNTINLGTYPSRNRGTKLARGNYIFVMDSDDLAFPNRIDRQISYMNNHPEVGICSSWFRILGASTNNNTVNYPSDSESLKIAFLENNYCLHPGLCIRKELFNGVEFLLYDEQYRYTSDYDFIAKNFKNFKICNIPEVLMEYRVHENQITSLMYSEQQFYADQIRINYLSNIELFPDEKEKRVHLSLVNSKFLPEFTMQDYLRWCNKLFHYNVKKHFFNNELLISFLRNKLKLQKVVVKL